MHEQHMRGFAAHMLFMPILFATLFGACIAQKPLGVTFTESGKGAGIQSGMVDKTATAATTPVGSLANSIGSAIVILEFTVKENGSKDGYPLQIKELRFTNIGTADVADLRFILEGPGSNNTVSSTSGSTVIFKDFGDIIVPDGDTTGRTYQVKVHVRSNIQGSMEDNQTIILKTSPTTDFDVVETSSNFLGSVSAFQQSPATSVDVVATELQGKGTFSFGTIVQGADFPGTQTVSATDANGRIDKNYPTNITLSAVGTDCASAAGCTLTGGGAVAPSAGVSAWSTLSCAPAVVTIKMRATSGLLPALCTAGIDITN